MIAVLDSDVDMRNALRRAAVDMADQLTEQWLLADLLAEAADPEVAALGERIGSACAELRALHRSLGLLGGVD